MKKILKSANRTSICVTYSNEPPRSLSWIYPYKYYGAANFNYDQATKLTEHYPI